MGDSAFLIGIDGGGSKTAVVLTDASLSPLFVEYYPRSNPGDIGAEPAISLITDSCRAFCEKHGVSPARVRALFAGIAGGSAGNFAQMLIASLSAAFPDTLCGVSDDGTNVLYASFPDRDGVSIICGTGSACFVKKDAAVYRIGGFGQFDLKGNGFEIGRAAFSHVFRVLDGRDSAGWLSDEINRRFGGSAYREIMSINAYGKNEFAKFAPLVFEAASEHGDANAMRILTEQLSHISDLIVSAKRFFPDGPYEVALSGGITKHPLTLRILQEHLPEDVRLFRAEREPYIGAAAKARALLSGDAPVVLPRFLPTDEKPVLHPFLP